MLDESRPACGRGPYERTDERAAYRAGHYERGFTTTSGQVTIKMPKLKGHALRHGGHRAPQKARDVGRGGHHRDASGRGVHAPHRGRQRGPRGAGVSADTVSISTTRLSRRSRSGDAPLARECPYVYVDGIYLKRSWGGSYESSGGHGGDRRERGRLPRGDRLHRGLTESSECWRDFLSWLKSRRLRGVRMFVGDKAAGMVGSIAESSPTPNTSAAPCTSTATSSPGSRNRRGRRRQPCSSNPRDGISRGGRRQGQAVADDLESMRLKEAAKVVRAGMPRRWRTAKCRARTLAAHTHEQRHRAAQQGNTPSHPRGRNLSRRQARAHAGGRPPEVRRRQRVGVSPLPGRVASQRAVVLTAS